MNDIYMFAHESSALESELSELARANNTQTHTINPAHDSFIDTFRSDTTHN